MIFVAAARGLPLVVVDDDGHVVDLLRGGEEGRFPDGALFAFAVAHEHETAIVPGTRLRMADRWARAMPKASGRP